MESIQAKELATRFVAGDGLTPSEEQSLLNWLEQRSESLDEFLADESMDGRLRCLNWLRSTEDEFVRTTVRALELERRAVSKTADFENSCVATKRRSRFRGSRINQAIVALVACAAALILGFVWWHFFGNGVERSPSSTFGFACITNSDGAQWGTPRAEGDRMAAGTLRLERGAADLRFDNGTVARLTAPVVLEMRSPEEVFLDRGTLAVRVPSQAVGFTVCTPVGRVVDLGTEFDVFVEEDSGKTETRVRKGNVLFEPQKDGDLPGNPIELSSDGLDRATCSVPDVSAPILPVTTTASNGRGRFVGVISANGKTMEFQSREAFQEHQKHVVAQLRNAPNQFGQKWSIMVKANARSNGSTTGAVSRSSKRSVTVRVNGRTVSIIEDSQSGITVKVTETVHGKEMKTVVKAANGEELKQKNGEVFRLYELHLGR